MTSEIDATTQRSINETLSMIPTLFQATEVEPIFNGTVRSFEGGTSKLFSAFGIDLFHVWLVKKNSKMIKRYGNTYDKMQLSTLIPETSLLERWRVSRAKSWFSNPDQATKRGIRELNREMAPNSFGVLFKRSHFVCTTFPVTDYFYSKW